MTEARILRLNASGAPLEWLSWQEAVVLYARDVVVWSIGDEVRTVLGGWNRHTGLQSEISLPSIIASAGERFAKPRTTYPLTNRTLFARDGYLCMYCGKAFPEHKLTRDHILPRSRGGKDNWMNVVSACRRCNQHKGHKTIEASGLELIATPYRPNQAEYLALVNSKRILADQMEFLSGQFSKNYRRPFSI